MRVDLVYQGALQPLHLQSDDEGQDAQSYYPGGSPSAQTQAPL